MWHWQAKGKNAAVLFIANVHVFVHHSIKNSRSNLYQKLKIQLLSFEKNSTGDQFHHFPLRGQKHLKWPCQALASDKLHFISLLLSKIKSTLHNAWNNMKYRLISIYHAFILVLPCTGGIFFVINSWHPEATIKRWNLETGIVQRGSWIFCIFWRSTGKTTLSPPENCRQCEHTGKKNRKTLQVCIGIMSFMLPCYETSSWQIWVRGFRWKSTNQQGAAVGISCTTILPWSCWGLWWHAVCEESALPKASFTDQDFYKRSLPPQRYLKISHRNLYLQNGTNGIKIFFNVPMINDSDIKKQRETDVFLWNFTEILHQKTWPFVWPEVWLWSPWWVPLPQSTSMPVTQVSWISRIRQSSGNRSPFHEFVLAECLLSRYGCCLFVYALSMFVHLDILISDM